MNTGLKKYTLIGNRLLIEIINDPNEIILSTSTPRFIRGKIIQIGKIYNMETLNKYDLSVFKVDAIVHFQSNTATDIYLDKKRFKILDLDHVNMIEDQLSGGTDE